MAARPCGFESRLSHPGGHRARRGPVLPSPPRPTVRTACLALAVLLTGCGLAGGARDAAAPPSETTAGPRPGDGLLARPDLQAVVELQLRRDGAALAALLASPDSLVRARAAFALGSVQDPEAVPALRRLLTDPSARVRADAAFALGQSADTTAGVALTAALRSERDAAARAEVLDALGKTGGAPDLADVVAARLPPELDAARALALARFLQRGVVSAPALDWLGGAVAGPTPALREAAAAAFVRIEPEVWAARAPALRAAFDGLAPGDPARLPLARALGRLGDAADLPRLLRAARSAPDGRTRVAATGALARHADRPSVRSVLFALAEDDDAHVAATAAGLLARAEPTPEETARLVELATDRSRPWPARAPLLPALARTAWAPNLGAWGEAERSPFARAAALRALGQSPDGATLQTLLDAAAGPDLLQATAALDALGARVGGASPAEIPRLYAALGAALDRGDVALSTTAAPALADSVFWPLGAGDRLRAAYGRLDPGDLEARVAVVQAAGAVRDSSQFDFLVGVILSDAPDAVREAARESLNERLTEGIDVDLSGGGARVGTSSIDWGTLARIGARPRWTLQTDKGTVVVELWTESAPQTVLQIARLSGARRYDGVPFHRVIPNFVVQGGDYLRGDGWGGPETPIRSELTRLRFETGTLGMASSGKDTEGVQFFLTHSPQPHLDGRYTAFGRVVRGQDVVDRLLVGDRIRTARIALTR